MAEYIERYKAIKELRDTYEFNYPTASGEFDEFATMLVPRVLKNLPTADVVEVKHGEWVENEDDFWVMCSECGTERYDDEEETISFFKYCPYCGAKMDLKEGAEE